MVTGFWDDLLEARPAERKVAEVFGALTNEYTFEEVGNQRKYFHKGDIKATAADGREIFIEVKNDSRIAQTHNVLCEEKVWYLNSNTTTKGNMYSDYQIYCVNSAAENKIYVIDFSILRCRYKTGRYKEIVHAEQVTFCYLCSLEDIKAWGALIAVVNY